MTVNISFTAVAYSGYIPDDSNPEIARKYSGVLNIYDGRATKARIAREIPNGATVESVHKVHYEFEVDGEKALAWFKENGEMKK